LDIFQGAPWFAICIWLSNFRTYMIMLQNYAGNTHKSYQNVKMKMDKANPDKGNIRGINLAAVNHTTVQVARLLL
jgi:hypothetical protein